MTDTFEHILLSDELRSIVHRLKTIGNRADADQWEIGRLVIEACEIGTPGVANGSGETLRWLATQQTHYTASSLRVFRHVHAAYFPVGPNGVEHDERVFTTSKRGKRTWLSYGGHKEVFGREDRLELLQTLVKEHGGDAGAVTVTMVKEEKKRRVKAEKVEEIEAEFAVLELYGPLTNAVHEMGHWNRMALRILAEGLPQSAEQRARYFADLSVVEKEFAMHIRRAYDPDTPIAPKIVPTHRNKDLLKDLGDLENDR